MGTASNLIEKMAIELNKMNWEVKSLVFQSKQLDQSGICVEEEEDLDGEWDVYCLHSMSSLDLEKFKIM